MEAEVGIDLVEWSGVGRRSGEWGSRAKESGIGLEEWSGGARLGVGDGVEWGSRAKEEKGSTGDGGSRWGWRVRVGSGRGRLEVGSGQSIWEWRVPEWPATEEEVEWGVRSRRTAAF